ncbi:MAG: TlpA family protein disulfide reductase, partial [Acidimicrobiales bacterium]
MTGRGQGRIAAVVVSAVLVVAGAAFAIYAASVAGQRSTALTETSTGNLVVFAAGHQRPVQPAELPRLGGGAPIELAARGGHPMVVNFFASWCTACQRELKAVAEVAGEKRVSFYGVDTDDPNHGLALLLLRRAGAH